MDTSGDGHPALATKSGAAAVGVSTDPAWNTQNVSSGGFATAPLPTTAGTPTTVAVTLAEAGGRFYQGVTSDPLLESYAVGAGGTSGTITGLTPGNSYEIYFYASNGRGTVGDRRFGIGA